METAIDCIEEGVLTPEDKIGDNGFFSVDKEMLPAKLSYFFVFAYIGSYIPFLNVFLRRLVLNQVKQVLLLVFVQQHYQLIIHFGEL